MGTGEILMVVSVGVERVLASEVVLILYGLESKTVVTMSPSSKHDFMMLRVFGNYLLKYIFFKKYILK
jgi:hypothetical protein